MIFLIIINCINSIKEINNDFYHLLISVAEETLPYLIN